MKETEYERQQRIFVAAIGLESPAERASYLEDACGEDLALRESLEALVREYELGATLTADGESPVAAGGNSDDTIDEKPGTMIGRYKILQLIAEGGFGSVYMAEQSEPVKRRVALKLIKPGMDSKQIIARFEAERQALALMDHPNIAKIFDAGTTGEGRPYFVMELVPGTDITKYCDENRLTTYERLKLFLQVCDAVQHAHQKGIIHRDIKPSNVLVNQFNGKPTPMVIDFGIAKATGQSLTDKTFFTNFAQMIGTPAYMSPEQAQMSVQDIDTRADVYSLGVLLYQLLTGTQPFTQKELLQKGYAEMQRVIVEDEPPRLSTRLSSMDPAEQSLVAQNRGVPLSALRKASSGDLDWIATKCLEKDRTRRYETVNGLAADISRHLTNEPILARPPSQLYRLQKLVKRNKAKALAMGSVALAVVLGVSMTMASLAREKATAQRERKAIERELKETVRADTVARFIGTLLEAGTKSMISQGNVAGAQDLIRQTDELASTSLSNAPAAELTIREILKDLLGDGLADVHGAFDQSKKVMELLPQVSDEQLYRPSDTLRLNYAARGLWAAGSDEEKEEKRKELKSLREEFLGRSPSSEALAVSAYRTEGIWLHNMSKDDEALQDEALQLLEKGYQLLPTDESPQWWEEYGSTDLRHRYPLQYSYALLNLGKPELAEKVVREALAIEPEANKERQDDYTKLTYQLCARLCAQNRFDEAIEDLEERAKGAAEGDLLKVQAWMGAVKARSGDARGALGIFERLSKHPQSVFHNLNYAAHLAAFLDEGEVHQEICREMMLRFASSADGEVAWRISWGMLCMRPDETTLAIAHGLVDRVEESSGWYAGVVDLSKAMLAFREERFAEALVALERYRNDVPEFPTSKLFRELPGVEGLRIFLQTAVYAELDRTEDAQREFAVGLEEMSGLRDKTSGSDRGGEWHAIYGMETIKREAETIFKAKGIALPE